MNYKIENLKIILVDDIEEEHLLFRKALSELPYVNIDFKGFKDACELQDYLKSDSTVPHIVFLDMYMPDKTGLECLQEIRNSEKFGEMLVAMYSVSSDESVIGKCLASGANIYITKPREFNELTARLHEVIRSCIQYHSMSMTFETFVKCV